MKSKIILTLVLSLFSIQSYAQLSYRYYEAQFIDNLWKTFPEWASGVGYHVYDSILEVPDTKRKAEVQAFYYYQLGKANEVKIITETEKTDLELIKNFLKSSLWSQFHSKENEWNPANYNACGTFSYMLYEPYDSLDNRMRNIFHKLAKVPAYYAAAQSNIKNPTIEHTQLAIEQNKNAKSIFESELKVSLNKVNFSSATKKEFIKRCEAATKAVNEYVSFLEKYPNSNPRSFRMGEEIYSKKFKNEIGSDYKIVFERAMERKTFLHSEMSKLTDQLWPKYFGSKPHPASNLRKIKMMIDVLSDKHCQADSFQATIEQQIPALVKFVNDKKLITMDPTKPLVVRREPDYMAGVAGASISSPGPYNKNANTYYNVGSLNGWSEADKESYLREYNDYILQILNIHEAIPGHYVQLIYANRSPSLIKSLFGNNAMIEGWAVYSELMMLENGYGGNTPEMWLMYYKWNLRSTCNTILDISLHTRNMTREDAIYLLTEQAFQQDKEAEGKWKRATLSNVQLCSYFSGFSQIVALRNKVCPTYKSDVNALRAFHEKFLSFGSIPVPMIEKLMTK